MNPHYADGPVTLYAGDCIEVMRGLPDASVDAVVTDPPYGLEFMGRDWDGADGFRRSLNAADVGRESTFGRMSANAPEYRAGKLFQDWCELWATEALRVLRPGGHLLAFGGTRTFHRLAAGIEDAGFEIRDSIAWLYGSGFPKSLDVSKAIDKMRDDTPGRQTVGAWLRIQREARGIRQKEVAAHWPSVTGGLTGCVANWEGGFNCPTWEQWLDLKRIVGFGDDMDPEVWRLNGRKGTPGEAWDLREITGNHAAGLATGAAGVGASGDGKERRDRAATDAAREWQGWGTALKPAFEPIVVARKPLTGTVAANVLAHGTGALNIDASRISHDEPAGTPSDGMHGRRAGIMGDTVKRHRDTTAASTAGRWPANVVLDETQAAALDQQSGALHTQKPTGPATMKSSHWGGGQESTRQIQRDDGDATGASRFFYTAKAPGHERPEVDGTSHPTVKPLDLMQWLVRLVTPKGGTVLEPFAGSGTTVEACLREGFNCIAIERELDYLPLVLKRVRKDHAVGFDFGDWDGAA